MRKEVTDIVHIPREVSRVIRKRVEDIVRDCAINAANMERSPNFDIACSCYLQGFKDAHPALANLTTGQAPKDMP